MNIFPGTSVVVRQIWLASRSSFLARATRFGWIINRGFLLLGGICLFQLGLFLAHAEVPGNLAQSESLVSRQEEVAQAFERLQGILLRLAELGGPREPSRAALVRRAIREAEELAISMRMKRAARLVAEGRLAAAIEEEEQLLGDLRRILEILLAEDRDRLLRAQRQELERLIRELGEITRRQKDLHARSARNDQSPEALAPEQSRLAEGAGELAKKLKGSDQESSHPRGTTSDGKSSSPGGRAQGEGEPPAAAKAGEGSGEEEGGKQGKQISEGNEGDTPASASAPSQDTRSSGGSGALPSSAESSRSREEAAKSVEAAQQRMEEAARRLADAKRREALQEQEEALRELEAARAQLEKILRQLRQEELARMLTDLRTRIERMLMIQRKVYEETVSLASQLETEDSRELDLAISRLRRQQSMVGLEADQTAFILEEDGTAGAMLEAIREVKSDIQLVEELFARKDLGPLNRSTQQAIIAALQEILDTLQERLAELERGEEQEGGGFGPGKMPFVNLLAELRMIRALQHRIRTRTEEYLGWLQESGDNNDRLREALQNLAERQARLQEITRNLSARLGP